MQKYSHEEDPIQLIKAWNELTESNSLQSLHRYQTSIHRMHQRALKNFFLLREMDPETIALPNETIMTGFRPSQEMKMWRKPNEPGEALNYLLSAISRQLFSEEPEGPNPHSGHSKEPSSETAAGPPQARQSPCPLPSPRPSPTTATLAMPDESSRRQSRSIIDN
jgi:hypothetical protein